MQQVNHMQFLPGRRIQREHDAIIHVAIESRATECNVAQDMFGVSRG